MLFGLSVLYFCVLRRVTSVCFQMWPNQASSYARRRHVVRRKPPITARWKSSLWWGSEHGMNEVACEHNRWGWPGGCDKFNVKVTVLVRVMFYSVSLPRLHCIEYGKRGRLFNRIGQQTDSLTPRTWPSSFAQFMIRLLQAHIIWMIWKNCSYRSLIFGMGVF